MRMTSFFVFLFGLSVGSFLNALLYRFERGESVCAGRSRCPHCGHTLSWYDLVPLLSFAMLGGKCRYCGERISWQYPIVELVTGIIFLLISLRTGGLPQGDNFVQTLLLWTIASLLIAIAVYDMKHFLIPDVFSYGAMGAAMALVLLSAYSSRQWDLVWNGLSAGFFAGAFFFALYHFSRGRWMGFGDVKLAFFIGLFLGWPSVLLSLLFAFTSGAFVGLLLMVLRKKTMRSPLPFAPFLVAGTFFAWYAGDMVLHWYLRTLFL